MESTFKVPAVGTVPAAPDGRFARWLRLSLPRLYLQRFPLFLGAFLLGYVPFALLVVPAMFRSTLVLTAKGLTVVTLFAVVASVVVMAARRIILLCGAARFNTDWPPVPTDLGPWQVIAHVSLAAPLVVIATWLSATEGELGMLRALAHAAAGIVGAILFLVCASIVHALLVDADETLPDLALPGARTRLRRFHQRAVPQGRLGQLVKRVIDWMQPYLGPGYFTPAGQIEPAHLYAAGIFVTFGLFYWGAYFLGKPQYDQGVPALVFILIPVTLVTIVLSAIAFLLDRHHLPTLLPVALWISLLAWVSDSDHYFKLTAIPDTLTASTPYEIAKGRGPLLTIVAVDGGGIQAAAWGATVLTRIEEQWREFHRSIGLISSVSGGSVGTVYFVSSLRADRSPTDEELRGVRAAATRGSLGEAAWGLAYADLWRALVPILPFYRFEKDRGWAMEEAWRRNFPPDQVPTLSDWIAGVRAGWMPAVSLNATTVETGQRFAFASFLPPEEATAAPGVRPWSIGTVLTTYPRHDIDMPTAARLSATFPYVSPIASARPADGVKAWHYGDGGYYDNTGMGIAMRWLDAVMVGHEAEYRNATVAFIRIRSSPQSADPKPKERAWAYDTIGPVVTLLNVRTSGQRERAETELEIVQRLWCQQHVWIRTFEFAFELPAAGSTPAAPLMKDPPLSWQLTAREKADLESAWATDTNQQMLRDYLALKNGPVTGTCTAPTAAAR